MIAQHNPHQRNLPVDQLNGTSLLRPAFKTAARAQIGAREVPRYPFLFEVHDFSGRHEHSHLLDRYVQIDAMRDANLDPFESIPATDLDQALNTCFTFLHSIGRNKLPCSQPTCNHSPDSPAEARSCFQTQYKDNIHPLLEKLEHNNFAAENSPPKILQTLRSENFTIPSHIQRLQTAPINENFTWLDSILNSVYLSLIALCLSLYLISYLMLITINPTPIQL